MHIVDERLCQILTLHYTTSQPHFTVAVTASGSHFSYTSHLMPLGYLAAPDVGFIYESVMNVGSGDVRDLIYQWGNPWSMGALS